MNTTHFSLNDDIVCGQAVNLWGSIRGSQEHSVSYFQGKIHLFHWSVMSMSNNVWGTWFLINKTYAFASLVLSVSSWNHLYRNDTKKIYIRRIFMFNYSQHMQLVFLTCLMNFQLGRNKPPNFSHIRIYVGLHLQHQQH